MSFRYSNEGKLTLDSSINNFLDEIVSGSPSLQSSDDQYVISNNINSMSFDLGMSRGRLVNLLCIS